MLVAGLQQVAQFVEWIGDGGALGFGGWGRAVDVALELVFFVFVIVTVDAQQFPIAASGGLLL